MIYNYVTAVHAKAAASDACLSWDAAIVYRHHANHHEFAVCARGETEPLGGPGRGWERINMRPNVEHHTEYRAAYDAGYASGEIAGRAYALFCGVVAPSCYALGHETGAYTLGYVDGWRAVQNQEIDGDGGTDGTPPEWYNQAEDAGV